MFRGKRVRTSCQGEMRFPNLIQRVIFYACAINPDGNNEDSGKDSNTNKTGHGASRRPDNRIALLPASRHGLITDQADLVMPDQSRECKLQNTRNELELTPVQQGTTILYEVSAGTALSDLRLPGCMTNQHMAVFIQPCKHISDLLHQKLAWAGLVEPSRLSPFGATPFPCSNMFWTGTAVKRAVHLTGKAVEAKLHWLESTR